MEYKINFGIWDKVFAVPECVASDYLKLARGNDLKVLMYLLYAKSADTDEICENTGVSSEAADEALIFWKNVGLFDDIPKRAENTATTAATDVTTVVRNTEKSVIKSESARRRDSIPMYTPAEMAERVEQSAKLKFLFSSTESSFGRPLNNTEQRTLIWIHDSLNMPVEVIVMLIEYTRSIERSNIHYIERMSVEWAETGIIDVQSAEKEIARLLERGSYHNRVKKAFGLDIKLSSRQAEYIDDWAKKGFSADMVAYAYEKCVDSINKLSWQYINKIILGWFEKGYKTRSDVDSEERRPAETSNEHSYDLDNFDKLAINYSGGGK